MSTRTDDRRKGVQVRKNVRLPVRSRIGYPLNENRLLDILDVFHGWWRGWQIYVMHLWTGIITCFIPKYDPWEMNTYRTHVRSQQSAIITSSSGRWKEMKLLTPLQHLNQSPTVLRRLVSSSRKASSFLYLTWHRYNPDLPPLWQNRRNSAADRSQVLKCLRRPWYTAPSNSKQPQQLR